MSEYAGYHSDDKEDMAATAAQDYELSSSHDVVEVDDGPVGELEAARDEFRRDLETKGYRPARIDYLTARRFGAQIAKLAGAGFSVDHLLLAETKEQSSNDVDQGMTRWAKDFHAKLEAQGKDNERDRDWRESQYKD